MKVSGAKLLGVHQHSDNRVAGQSAMALDRLPGIAQTLPTRSFAEADHATFWLVKASLACKLVRAENEDGVRPQREMSPEISIRVSEAGRRYEAVLRISEALSACREPEDLTRILSEQLHEFLDFFQFYIIVYKENSTELEWAWVGSEKSTIRSYAELP